MILEEALDFGLFSKGYIFYIIIVVLVIRIGMIVWMVKDAKSRGINPTLWGVLIGLLGWIGCLIYFVSRERNTPEVLPA